MFDRITWRGETRGPIKKLAGFTGHHRIPTTIDPASTDFLRRAGSELVAEHCAELHQELRSAFGYRRRELVVSEEPGLADLLTPDFTVHVSLEQDPEERRRYRLVTELTRITRPESLYAGAFRQVFEGLFHSVVFAPEQEISIDDVIDRVEEQETDDRVSVDFPPDASHCLVRLRGTRTALHFTPQEVTLRADAGASLSDLLEAAERLPELLGADPDQAAAPLGSVPS